MLDTEQSVRYPQYTAHFLDTSQLYVENYVAYIQKNGDFFAFFRKKILKKVRVDSYFCTKWVKIWYKSMKVEICKSGGCFYKLFHGLSL